MMRKPFEDLEEGVDQIARLDGVPFSGVAYAVDARGRVSSEIEFANGVQHGLARDYDASGRCKAETTFKEGARDGPERHWREDGSLLSETEYELDILVERRTWDAMGGLTEHFVLDASDPLHGILNRLRRARGRPPR
jgi:hypothetical protein